MATTHQKPLELLTPSAVARMLGVDDRTLSDWRYRGDGPPTFGSATAPSVTGPTSWTAGSPPAKSPSDDPAPDAGNGPA